MWTRVSLSKKVLLFLAVLLTLQLIFISALVSLQFAAEEQTRKATRAGRLATLASNLSSEIFSGISSFTGGEGLQAGGGDPEMFKRSLVKGGRYLNELKIMTADNEKEHQQVLLAEKSMSHAVDVVLALQKDYDRNGAQGELSRAPLWNELRKISSRDLFKQLNAMAAEEEKIVEQDPTKQAQFRSQLRTLLFGSLAMTIFSILALAKYLVGEITSRLSVMHDNAYRLASDLPLNPPLPGNDEIAVLDRTFHNLAELLQEAADKERAIVDNAQDVICSLDDEGRFVSVNAAVEKLLGRKPAQLIGRQVIELIQEEDLTTALGYFGALQNGKDARPLEVRMRNTMGDTIDTLWTAHWSDKDNSLFCVIHDMTIRNRTERLKEEVMAMVNHDLRTPLTTVQVSLELLKAGEKGKLSKKSEALIENMTVSCNQILRLTQDLLDLDRMESGHMELEIEDCNIGDVAEQAIDLTSGLAHRQRIRISTDLQNLIVAGDSHRLEQVMTNILTNALKFSPADSSIHIAVRPSNDGSMAKVSISDQGPGIPANMLDKVFDRYQQVKDGHRSKPTSEDKLSGKNGGSGLGLAICKALVEQHGGRIWVESNAQSGPNSGATFIFTVPLVRR